MATLKTKSPAERMAENIAEIIGAGGGISNDDLTRLGWSLADIAEHGGEAFRLASARAERQIEAA